MGETNRREVKAEVKRRQKRREDRREGRREEKRRKDGREEREGISEGTDGSLTSPALAKKPAGIGVPESGVPESETLNTGFENRHWRDL